MSGNSNGRQPRVFISYSRADKPRVARLVEALKAAGISVWWDTHIEGGSHFSADIERELEAADAVVAAWSETSVKSGWVLDEAGHGRDAGRLVPVQLDKVMPPLGFRQVHAVDLSGWKGAVDDAQFVALLNAIRRMAGKAPVTAPLYKPTKPKGPSRRLVIGGAAGAAALAAVGFGAWRWIGGDRAPSVAVLPFENMSGDPSQAYLADGLAEELRTALSQISGLKVVGRVSSEKFRDAEDLSKAADELGVDHVLTGSVRRSPGTIRIGAELIDGDTGVERWSQSYDQPVADALAVQTSIASNVLAAVSGQLGAASPAAAGTSNHQAQELFMRQREMGLKGFSEPVLRERLALLDKALTLDPRYGEALAVKGDVLEELAGFAATLPAEQALETAALAAAREAVAAAPKSGFAHMELALRLLDQLDVRAAVAEARRAIALAPGDWRVADAYADVMSVIDPAGAVAISKTALDLDPHNAASVASHAGVLAHAGRFGEAEAEARRALALSGNRIGMHPLVIALLAEGEYAEARRHLLTLPHDWQRQTYAAILEARAGNRAASDAAMARLKQIEGGALDVQLAEAHAQRGETEAALAALEAAWQRRDPALATAAVTPFLVPLRDQPRFKAVIAKVVPPDLFVPLKG